MLHRRKTLFSLLLSAGLCLGLAALDTTTGVGDGPREARADTAEARRSASVMSSPGEKSRVVTRVRAGTKLNIISKKGRWLKVRVNGRTGWIARSNVESRQARSTVRKNRRRPFVEGRSRKRGQRKSAPKDRVGADAVDDEDVFLDDEELEGDEEFADDEELEGDEEGDDSEEEEPEIETVTSLGEMSLLSEPSAKRGDEVAALDEGDTLVVLDRDGDWLQVENANGDVGWVESSDVDSGGYRYEKLGKSAWAAIGYQALGQTFVSDGAGELANYSISSGALVATLGGEVIYDYSEKYLLAADGRYRFVRASPGVAVQVGGVTSNIAFQSHEIDLAARGGYKISKKSGLAAYGRVGYHYGNFGISEVDNFESNIAYLPSEILSGITLGALVDMPHYSDKLAFRLGVDLLFPNGKRVQTAGLEDGAASDVSALWANAQVNYQWKPNLAITGSYQYYQSKTVWSGAAPESMRPHGATAAERKDKTHTLYVGLGRAF